MKNIPQQMKEHLQGEVTNLCRCWILETTKGDKLGFTDHDKDIEIDGVLCERDAGVESSGIEGRVGLSVDSSDVSGALQSDFVTEKDIASGRYDNARISTYLVHWSDSSQYFLDRVSLVGEITREDGFYKMELRALASQLDQSKGNHFVKRCQANLGDGRCKVNLGTSEFTVSGQIASIKSAIVLTVSGVENFASGWFRSGQLTWSSGSNIERRIEIAEHIKKDGVTVLHLWQAMPDEVQTGDQFELTTGCDKQFSTCKGKFSNVANFRGFPHVPGNDFALGHAGNSENLDGGPLVP